MNIVRAVMVPHPPILLPAVGRGEEKKIAATTAAYEQAAGFIRQAKPDTIVVLTPHSVLYRDYFHISPGESASGSFAQFGAPGVKLSVRYDAPFVRALERAAAAEKLSAGTLGERDRTLDHAAMIPLWFLQNAYQGEPLPPVVRIGLSGLPLTEHYRLGMLLSRTAEQLSRRVCVVASGDLSHRLKPDGPYGFRAEGPQYDRRIMDVMGRASFGELFDFPETFCETAGECGHRSFTIMAGCFDGLDVTAEKLSYEGPFGVGYGVCLFTPGGENPSRRFYDAELLRRQEEQETRRSKEDEYVRLARLAVETYVRTGKTAEIPEGTSPELLNRRAGAFVSLHLDGELRGCIGTISAVQSCLAKEIVRNGISACSEDPRFPAVTREELTGLVYSVDVLGDAESIASPAELDVKKYGVIVTRGYRRGLLLPDLEGVDTVEQQIGIAKKKAGIRPEEAVSLERFEVVRHV
jgi:AmmeMemoRadiSam system protein A